MFGRAWERHNLDVSRDVSKRRRPFVQEHRKPTFNWMPECLSTRHASTPHVAGDVCVHEVRVRPARFDLRFDIDPRVVVFFRRGPSEVQQMTLKRPPRVPRGRVLPMLKFAPSERHDVAVAIVVSPPLMLSPRIEETPPRSFYDAALLFFFRTPTPTTSRQSRRRDHRFVRCVVVSMPPKLFRSKAKL